MCSPAISCILDVRRRGAAALAGQEGKDEGGGGAEEADVLEDVVGTGALAAARGEVLVCVLDAGETASRVVVLVAAAVQDLVVEALRARGTVVGGAAGDALERQREGLRGGSAISHTSRLVKEKEWAGLTMPAAM